MSKTMPLSAHFEELRKRLITSLVFLSGTSLLSFIFRKNLFHIISYPHDWVMGKLNLDSKLYVLNYQDNFMIQFKICLIFGLFLALPFISYQLYKFIGEALSILERKIVFLNMPLFFGLFILGCLFGYYYLIPASLLFLMSFGKDLGLTPMINFSDYTSLFFLFTFVTGLVFELPLIMMIVARLGLFKAKDFRGKRKFAILIAFIVGAILTPPDPVSQIILAFCLILLYELGCILAYFVERNKSKICEQTTS